MRLGNQSTRGLLKGAGTSHKWAGVHDRRYTITVPDTVLQCTDSQD
jgi:hypothetical protein